MKSSNIITAIAICLAAATASASTSTDISRIYREGRREMQEISRQNRQEFNDFCNSLQNNSFGGGFGGGGFVGGGFGGMPMPQPQPPPAMQLVTALSNALISDMNPAKAAQFQQVMMQFGMQSGGNQAALAQLLANASAQLGVNSDADSQRMSLCCGLVSLSFQGAQPMQIAAALVMMARQLDANGFRWHRRGNFGRILNLLSPVDDDDDDIRRTTPKYA